MKITRRIISALLLSLALVSTCLAFVLIQSLENRLQQDLRVRGDLLTQNSKASIESFMKVGQKEFPSELLQKLIVGMAEDEALIGIRLRLMDGRIITSAESLPSETAELKEVGSRSMRKKGIVERVGKWAEQSIHEYKLPLKIKGQVLGVITFYHDRSFIDEEVNQAWILFIILFLFIGAIISTITFFIVRLTVTDPLSRMSELTKKIAESGSAPNASLVGDQGELGNLFHEVTSMATSLRSKRLDELHRGGIHEQEVGEWNRDTLKSYLKKQLGHKPLYVVANREPYMHVKDKGKVECIFPASGMVSALDPVMQATEGVWVGQAMGNADKENSDEKGCVAVPPKDPKYTLKRVWLSEEEEQGFYAGFSNEGIWPLCHIAHARPMFRLHDWEMYQTVNQKFADALLEEIEEDNPFILIQDYHFALLPKYIRKAKPNARIGIFWHIPWSNAEVFSICPWKEDILEGMLACDLIGFHTQFHCNNFLDTVDRVLESRIDWNHYVVTRAGKQTRVRAFPISIDPFVPFVSHEDGEQLKADLVKKYGLEGKEIGLGVDRIDYIKGLIERFLAIERFLEKYPEKVGKFVFVELGALSRAILSGYKNHLQDVEEHVIRINKKYGNASYKPILFLTGHHSFDTIRAFYEMADFCLVNSLHDGMNLVAKEYVAYKKDLNGSLILSRFTGASLELKSALLINPYDIEQTADTIFRALDMAPAERHQRMKDMRERVLEHNVYRWAAKLISDLVKVF